jgi:hypothetical protein
VRQDVACDKLSHATICHIPNLIGLLYSFHL